jgi:hypothetical protein
MIALSTALSVQLRPSRLASAAAGRATRYPKASVVFGGSRRGECAKARPLGLVTEPFWPLLQRHISITAASLCPPSLLRRFGRVAFGAPALKTSTLQTRRSLAA